MRAVGLLADLISVFTLHLFFLYQAAVKLYHVEIRIISALWRLFRGRKWNVLRERVDSAAYDVDQLLLGTLGFTVACFLLPTIGVYYTFLTIVYLILSVACVSFQCIAHV